MPGWKLVKSSQFGAVLALSVAVAGTMAGDFRPPAGEKPALRSANGSSILPGGKVVQPLGSQIPTGPGPVRIVASASGHRVATVNLGPERSSVTFLERDRKGLWSLQNFPVTASGGIAFWGEKFAWVSEGVGGAIRLMDFETGARRKLLELNRGATTGSFSGDLALDSARGLLFVVDPAHKRVVIFDLRTDAVVAEIGIMDLPSAVALGPDGTRAYVLCSSSVAVFDVIRPADAKLLATVPAMGLSGILATPDAVYVSNSGDDSIEVLDPATAALRKTVLLRIPGLESLLGIRPLGMAYEARRHWLLVAESGINAIGVIDPASGQVLGHLPVGWFPTSVVSENGTATVANAKGRGTGPSSVRFQPDALEFEGFFRRGSVSRFELPDREGLAKPTRLVLAANGLLPIPDRPRPAIPVHHVVLIVKGSRTFDDILGDMKVAGSQVAGLAQLARFGNEGYADGGRKRFSLQQIPVTPNHHALAEQFSFSDNFYAGADEGEGDAGLEAYLQSRGVSFLQLGEGFDGVTSDQSRAARVISELEKRKGLALPQFVVIHLPNDQTAPPQPQDGYPYAASYVADNDLALGRIIESLSHSPWWREMAIFVLEADAEGGRDHIDSHRSVFLGVSPWFRRGYVSHTNANEAAVLKAAFGWLGVPPWRLEDAAAADLGDLLTAEPDFSPYSAMPIDRRLFDGKR